MLRAAAWQRTEPCPDIARLSNDAVQSARGVSQVSCSRRGLYMSLLLPFRLSVLLSSLSLSLSLSLSDSHFARWYRAQHFLNPDTPT